MGRPVVTFDFDDVIGNFNGGFVDFHNQTFEVPFMRYEDITDFDMTKLYDVNFEEIVRRVVVFCHEHHYMIEPCVGVQTSLNRLSNFYDIHVVTSRCESLYDITDDWLRTHDLRQYITELHFMNSFGTKYPKRKRAKSDVCKQLRAIGHVEDAPEHARTVANVGIPVVLPDRPWNHGFKHTNVTREYNMSEIHF